MLRVVLDTNVLVSAVVSDGKPRKLFMKGLENKFSIVTSDLLLAEFARVVRRSKFRTNDREIRRMTLALRSSAEVINVKTRFSVVKDDPEDDVVIETAYDGHADFIVTGDNHLLALQRFRGIEIISVEMLFDML